MTIRNLVGKIGLAYALHFPAHRGKFRVLWLLDAMFGPFQLQYKAEKIELTVYLSSSMDLSYFRRRELKNSQEKDGIDEWPIKLVKDLKPGDIFVDIGANIGFLSIIASQRVGPTGLVIAIEPSTREYTRLVGNLALNAATNVLPIHGALGEQAGIASFEVSDHHTGLNRLESTGHSIGRKVKVPVFRGGDLLLGLLPAQKPAALVKIDVEGAEFLVLSGLKSYLEKMTPRKLVVEITPRFLEDFGSSRRELYAFMAEMGYEARFNLETAQYDEVFRAIASGA